MTVGKSFNRLPLCNPLFCLFVDRLSFLKGELLFWSESSPKLCTAQNLVWIDLVDVAEYKTYFPI